MLLFEKIKKLTRKKIKYIGIVLLIILVSLNFYFLNHIIKKSNSQESFKKYIKIHQ